MEEKGNAEARSLGKEPEGESRYTVVDVLTLRFDGSGAAGEALHELKASHVSDVLEGISELARDFEKAGAFHGDGPDGSDLLVRPAQEGSFIIEVLRVVQENPEVATAAAGVIGVPSLAKVVEVATRSMRAEVQDFDYLENGNVRIQWQDDTSQEVPLEVWNELNKQKSRKKKQLRKIMAPLQDPRVRDVQLYGPDEREDGKLTEPSSVLDKDDLNAAQAEDEVDEQYDIFEAEGRMSAIDFDNPDKWRIKIEGDVRTAKVEDAYFLTKVKNGLQIGSDDVFRLQIREDRVTKNERTTTKWTVLRVDPGGGRQWP